VIGPPGTEGSSAVDPLVVETAGRFSVFRVPARVHPRYNVPLAAGLTLILFLVLGSFIVPAVSPYGPQEANPADALVSPSLHHPFGTDESGFDVMTRVFYAARIDLSLSALGVGLGLLAGILLGVAAGFSRGLLGEIAMRVVDLIQAFPLFILAVALVALGGNHLSNIVWALAFLTTPIFLRLIRSRVLTIREQRYIEAAVALGNSRRRLLLRHVLPNALSPVIVQFGISMGYAILTIAGLAFLGVGVQVPTPEWGSMILIGRNNITTGQWWTVVFPGIWLALAVVGLNLLSDGVERAREVHR
jgi:peptide/nickel transport system permease protein